MNKSIKQLKQEIRETEDRLKDLERVKNHYFMITVLIFTVILSLTMSVHAYAMRCGTQIIDTGDSTTKVIQACGSPASITRGGVLDNTVIFNYKKDGTNYTITFIDQKINDISQNNM